MGKGFLDDHVIKKKFIPKKLDTLGLSNIKLIRSGLRHFYKWMCSLPFKISLIVTEIVGFTTVFSCMLESNPFMDHANFCIVFITHA